MQTKTGKDAKGPTAEEFVELLSKEVFPEIKRLTSESHKSLFARVGFIWSMDNEKIHDAAWPTIKQQQGLTDAQRMKLPAKSPDMHKVIEHVMGNLKTWFQYALLSPEYRDKRLDTAGYMALMKDIFFTKVTQQSVYSDVMSLADTYHEIELAQGGWAPSWCR